MKYLIVVIFSVFSMVSAFAFPPPQDVKVVEVSKANYEDLHQTVRLIGTIKAKHATTFIAKDAGTIEFLAKPGQMILKDGVIASFSHADLQNQYSLSENAEKIAHEQYDRFQKLLKSDSVSKQAVEEKRNALIEAQKNLSNAKIALDKNRILAPFTGVVGVFKVSEGSDVQPGDTIVSFYDPSELVVEFDIPELLLSKVNPGQKAWINGQVITVSALQKALDPNSHMSPAAANYACQQCVIGSNVDIDLEIETKPNALVIPYDAVFLREGKTYVYTVENGKIALKAVKLGIREKEKVEVLAGLKSNMQIVASNQAALYPELPVKIA